MPFPPFFRAFLLILSFSFTSSSALFAQFDGTINGIDQYIEKARKEWKIPGLAVAIVKDGKVVLAKGYGNLEAGKEAKADENTLFAIASNTKAFIATALGILVEEGKLSWNDPVQKHLPYFRLYDNYVSQQMKVKDLLCHRSGLGTFSGDVVWYKSNYSAKEIIQRAAELPKDFDFRDGYGYSNIMFITAGEVIQAVSGMSWSAFIGERIFSPLKMERSQFSVNALKSMDNIASPHKQINEQAQAIPWVNWDNMGAAGGIISSVSDMAKWMLLNLNEGILANDTIFAPSTQTKLWTPHNNFRVSQQAKAAYPGRHFSGYGLGWSLSDYGGSMIASHGGGYDGMYSRVTLAPDAELGVVVLTNAMKSIAPPLTNYILDIYLDVSPKKDWCKESLERIQSFKAFTAKNLAEKKEQRLLNTQASLPLSDFTGQYECSFFGPIEIKESADQLQLHFPNAPLLNAELSHWHLNTFEIKWQRTHAWFDFGTLQFILDNDGKVQELQFDVPNYDIFFHEIQAKRIAP